jgi:hypothetical protein
LSEEEERISLPLQALNLALFDAVLVHMMNTLSPDGEWLTIKRRLCDALFVNKQVPRPSIAHFADKIPANGLTLSYISGSHA